MTSDAGSAEVRRGTAEWVFKPIAERPAEFPNDLQGFCALQGHRYQGELMVIGRACDWKKLPKEPPDGEGWEGVARELATSWSMSWVIDQWGPSEHDYNTAKSAFWRVIRRVSLELLGDAIGEEEDWPTHLVWSNLYKVSPYRKNPGAPLRRAQRDACKELLKLEIRTFRPKRVLFLTGWDWAEELVCAPPESGEPAGTRFVDKVWGQPLDPQSGSAISSFVVAQHPQGKKEDRWVDEVLEEFRALHTAHRK